MEQVKSKRWLGIRAQEHRKNQTDAEVVFGHLMTARCLKYLAQCPITIIDERGKHKQYIADFKRFNTVIEIDGGYHFTEEQSIKDTSRDEYLLQAGYRTIRFANEDVLTLNDNVINTVNGFKKAGKDWIQKNAKKIQASRDYLKQRFGTQQYNKIIFGAPEIEYCKQGSCKISDTPFWLDI